tara:strand:+ start:4374 stop:4589 length:216 start_codon:yes stop_codon:yes gene_type:complete
MDNYKNDVANNIIALARARGKKDPRQIDSEIFKSYFRKTLAPAFKAQYGLNIRYGSFKSIALQASKAVDLP